MQLYILLTEVFRTNYAAMIEQIKPTEIYHKLYSGGLITQTERDNIFQYGDSRKGTTELVNAVERAIAANPSNFKIFLNILKTERRYSRLIMFLKVN